MRSWVGRIGAILVCASVFAGCGGGSSNNKIVTVTVTPSTLTLVSGDVTQLTVSAQNSAGTAVTANATFTSSNTNLVTVSSASGTQVGGSVCAGVWDANFIVCKGTDASGNPLVGTATINVTAGGVTSSVTVTVHLPLSSIVVDPMTGCTSIAQTQQFTPHACSAVATPHDPGPPCGPGAKEITSLVGTFIWQTTDVSVGTIDTNGLVTSVAPGQNGVIARIGNVSSPATAFRSCMPVSIILHINGDPPGSPTTSATLNVSDTRKVEADMTDENNVTTNSAPVTIVSNHPQIATVSSTTLTGQSPGGASLLAVCKPPGCGNGVNLPIYSNPFLVTVNGATPATTVYATTSFAPPSGTTPTLLPIASDTKVAGTAINLPGVANSLVFTLNGAKGYLGTSAGLASLDTATNVVTVVSANVLGKVLAVSVDGNQVIVSNAAKDPATGVPIQTATALQRLAVFNVSNNTIQTFILPGATAAAFTNDGFKAFIVADCSQNTPPLLNGACAPDSGTNQNQDVFVFSPVLSLQTLNVGGSSAKITDVTTLPSGPLAYLLSGSPLNVLGTCNNKLQAPPLPTATSAPQLVGSFKNSDTIVALNQTGVDINTAALTSLTPPAVIDNTSCVPAAAYTPQFIDFGLGSLTAHQLLVPTNIASPVVVLPAGINKVLTAVAGGGPGSIALAGAGTEALSGGLTIDGTTAWVGVAGTNTVDRIDLVGATDTDQVATNFKKSDGTTPAPPNIVAVKPK